MMLSVRLSLDRIGARFTWLVSQEDLVRLRRSIVRGQLGPAQILEVRLAETDDSATDISAAVSA